MAAPFRLHWKSVAVVVEGAVLGGLAPRPWKALHRVGIDEVSRRKGQQDLTLVYDLERGRVFWVGKDRSPVALPVSPAAPPPCHQRLTADSLHDPPPRDGQDSLGEPDGF